MHEAGGTPGPAEGPIAEGISGNAGPRYDYKPNPLTVAQWRPTGEVSPTASAGKWVADDANNRIALMKPGSPAAGRLDPAREYIASVIGGWVAVRVPECELYVVPDQGPAVLSLRAGQAVFKWQNVMVDPLGEVMRARAMEALKNFSGVVALDALLGAQDRQNPGNAIYVEDRQEWFSLDYSYSFNTSSLTTNGSSADAYNMPYYGEMINAVGQSPEPLRRSMALIEGIPNDAIEGLLGTIPHEFASDQMRTSMVEFLKHRRDKIRTLVSQWCTAKNLGGLV